MKSECVSGDGSVRGNVPGLGKGHPKDKDELEGVVEGWEKLDLDPTSRRRTTYGTSRRR